ncbi:MAG: outer membrane protein beta-barrel domain [Acidobacteriota bacterium]|jgi:opacity protein-like surface antigen|nr:outer membrane protein beta-barrel domain [Acidobacteriota bacterium]
MRKLLFLAMLIVASASMVFAQSTDRAKPEFFAGFSVDSIDTGIDSSGVVVHNANNRQTAYGFETSGTGYFNNRVGIEGNFDGHYKTKTFDVSATATSAIVPVRVKLSEYNFMAGPHVRFPSSDSKVVPFLHALFGGNHSRTSGTATGIAVSDNATDFALKLGGGVDFGVSEHVGVRLSADYNPVFERNNDSTTTTSNNRTRNDAIFSVGFVFK